MYASGKKDTAGNKSTETVKGDLTLKLIIVQGPTHALNKFYLQLNPNWFDTVWMSL